MHGVVTATDVGNTSHAGNTFQHVKHVDSGEVTEVYLVKTRVG